LLFDTVPKKHKTLYDINTMIFISLLLLLLPMLPFVRLPITNLNCHQSLPTLLRASHGKP
jgi:hypothetical protein